MQPAGHNRIYTTLTDTTFAEKICHSGSDPDTDTFPYCRPVPDTGLGFPFLPSAKKLAKPRVKHGATGLGAAANHPLVAGSMIAVL